MNVAEPFHVTSGSAPDSPSINVSSLLVELDHYRRQSRWLSRINALHARLAGALDLAGMVEAFSVWLMPLAEHDLIGYRNVAHGRQHMVCSCHGPDRRRILRIADKQFQAVSQGQSVAQECEEGFYVHYGLLVDAEAGGILLLLRRGRPFSSHEMEVIEEGMAVLNEPLQRAVEYEDLFEQARSDSLTGLANRRVLEERLTPLIDAGRRHNHPITLASMDLDHFKQINDSLGHAEGDRVLRLVAQTVATLIRSSDLLVRVGGDEFLMVMPNTDLGQARILAERLCRAVDRLDIRAPGAKPLGVSIGLTQLQPGMGREEWLQRADESLYQAKAAGRARVWAA